MTRDALRDPADTAYALARGTWEAEPVRQTTIELPSSRAAAAGARREIETHFGGLVDERRLHDLQLVVTELITNVVLHSGSEDVVIHMAAAPDRVRAEVYDAGAGFDPSAVEARESGGLGLMLVERLATRWGAAIADGTCVWVEIDL